MQKKTEGLFVGLCLVVLAVLCGIATNSSYTEKNIQTTYSVASDGVPAFLQVMDENVKESICTITAVAENTVQVQKEMFSAARANAEALAAERARAEAEALAAERARAEAEALAAEQARAEAEALAVEQARAEAEALAAEQARAEAEALAAEQAENTPVPVENIVIIEDEETATAATPGESIEQENVEEVIVQERMTVSELMQCINAERSAVGLAPLSWSDDLAAAAGVRSVEAVSRFEHVRPDGSNFFTVSELAMAENLARGNLQTAAQEIVDKWMESTGGHRQNILDSGLYTIGIAIYEKDGQLTICALFG